MALTAALHADTWSLLHDNDFVFDSDDRYSAGLQIGWTGSAYEAAEADSFNRAYISAMSSLLALTGVSFEGRRRSGAISLQEMMITPSNLESRVPIYDDVPYAGILSADFALFAYDDDDFDTYRLSVGILGPDSGAESLQKAVHKLVGATDPKGWDNQLGTKAIIQAGYAKGIRQYVRKYAGESRLEWFNSYYVDIGTLYSGAGVGSSLRYGVNMPRNFAASGGLLNNITGDRLGLEEGRRKWGWEIRAGIALNGVAYFYYFDEAKRRGYTFDRPRLIPKANIGASLYLDGFRLSLDLFPEGSSNANTESSSFGRISFTWWPGRSNP